jgi:cation:H+ antiporter
MIGISFLILPLVFFFKRNQLSKIEGVILLSVYISFIYPLISK